MSTKRCFKCACEKPLDDFYKHARMKDGRLNKCIECTKLDVRRNRADNIEHYRSFDRMRGSMPHRVAARAAYLQTPEGKAASARAARVANARFPERRAARVAISNAIRSGKVIAWPVCEIPGCTAKPEAHHADYSLPLDVTWLCDHHHKATHKLARELKRAV